MKNQIRHIAILLFTILMVFQIMHVGHTAEHFSHFFRESSQKHLELLSQNSESSYRKDFEHFSKKYDQHKFCLICHSNTGHYLIWDLVSGNSFAFTAFIDWLVFFADSIYLSVRHHQFAVISLRGPPSRLKFIL